MSDLSEDRRRFQQTGLPAAQEVPAEVTRVQGCDCGGLTMHRTDCSLWDLDGAEQMANVDEAQQRLQDHVAVLNAQLHARFQELT